MRYYTPTHLSDNIMETPEGYLLCPGVAIARTGVQEYLPEEVPEDVAAATGSDVPVRVYRMAADVFAPAAMASFEGKSVTIQHPPGEDEGEIVFVTPETWRELTVGIAQNIRPGEGKDEELLLADLLITDAAAIRAVRGGLREVSCGYDAEYEALSPGVGKQVNIVGNHIALVEHGRCGPRCKINDATKEAVMAKKPGFFDKLFANPKVRKAMDEAMAEETTAPPVEEKQATDEEAKPTGDADPAAMLEEMLLLLRSIAEKVMGSATGDEDKTCDEDPEVATGDEDPAPPEGEKEKTPTGDRARKSRTADADTVRRAKILTPGLAVRTGDSLCVVQRAALRGVQDTAVRRVVDSCLRGTPLGKADCLTLDAAFTAASEVAALANNSRTADNLTRQQMRDFGGASAPTPADINAMNRKFYGKEGH